MIYDMITANATDIRKNWSETLDTVRKKPVFMRRTHDDAAIMNIDILRSLLNNYRFTATALYEADGSVTLSSNELDIAINAPTLAIAKRVLAADIAEYALEFYADFDTWSAAPNRKAHIPYVMKALMAADADELEDSIVCRGGKN